MLFLEAKITFYLINFGKTFFNIDKHNTRNISLLLITPLLNIFTTELFRSLDKPKKEKTLKLFSLDFYPLDGLLRGR